MVRRSRSATFMGNARVFPGGVVEPADDSETARAVVRWSGPEEEFAWRAAALRELAEEAGIVVGQPGSSAVGPDDPAPVVYEQARRAGIVFDADRLVYLANWVTPAGLPRRYDTRFYVTIVGGETVPVADDREVFDPVWVAPAEAIARGDAGEWDVEFPTRVVLWMIDGCDGPDAVVAAATSARRIERIEPVLDMGDNGARVLLPTRGERP